LALFATCSLNAANVAAHAIRSVAVSQASLNVAAHEVAAVSMSFAARGAASVVIVDRDGFPVRSLARSQPVGTSASFGWDGRDDRGQIVPDEAYSFRIEWRGPGRSDLYFPADTPPPPLQRIEALSYNRRTATLSYVLPQPSRVHIQAGTAVPDPVTKEAHGLTMKTVVNREPRSAGAIAEHWTGFDESGAIFIPDLKDFIVAIAATPLPENSIITFGNAGHPYVETIATRRGASLFTHRTHGAHHSGLPTADDVSPSLKMEPLNAAWSPADHVWTLNGSSPLRVRVTAHGPTASTFSKHPATIERFIDGRRLGDAERKNGDIVEIPLDARNDIQRISINWNSDWGPVAANTIQVRRRSASGRSEQSSR
jgi:hypothetical protein